MPENETLHPDARNASRWQPLRDLLRSGKPADELCPDIEIEFYGTLRRFWKLLKKQEVDVKALLDAALSDHKIFQELVRKTRFHDYAKLLNGLVAANPAANSEQLLRSWLEAIWDNVRDQLELDRHQCSADLRLRVQQMLDRLHSHLSRDPSCISRCPSRNRKLAIDETLSISLL